MLNSFWKIIFCGVIFFAAMQADAKQEVRISQIERYPTVNFSKWLASYVPPFAKAGDSVKATVVAVQKDGIPRVRQVMVWYQDGRFGAYLDHKSDIGQALLHGFSSLYIVADDNETALEITTGAVVDMSQRHSGLVLYTFDPREVALLTLGKQKKSMRTINEAHLVWHSGKWRQIPEVAKYKCFGSACL